VQSHDVAHDKIVDAIVAALASRLEGADARANPCERGDHGT
jgi:hypothetical protein